MAVLLQYPLVGTEVVRSQFLLGCVAACFHARCLEGNPRLHVLARLPRRSKVGSNHTGMADEELFEPDTGVFAGTAGGTEMDELFSR